MTIFDRASLRRHRLRAMPGFAGHDFLFREVAARLVERLGEVRRRFPLALDIGCRGGIMAEALGDGGGIETLIGCDLAAGLLPRAGPRLVADEEVLPFADGGLDLIVSALALHWVNDLPGTLLQIRRALRPDGLFLAALLGGDTLVELRAAMAAAEIATEGGIAPRVSPMIDTADAGALMQRAGFALPMVDVDTITVRYRSPLALMRELRGMGESNAVAARPKGFARRTTLAAAVTDYERRFGGDDGRVPATFQILYLTGWAPHAAQPRPLDPGSARARLADALGARERPTGDKTRS